MDLAQMFSLCAAVSWIDDGNDDPDYAMVQKCIARAMENLDEVITICWNAGFAWYESIESSLVELEHNIRYLLIDY